MTAGPQKRVSAGAGEDGEMSADEKGRLRETMKHIGGSGAGRGGLTVFETLWFWKWFYPSSRNPQACICFFNSSF